VVWVTASASGEGAIDHSFSRDKVELNPRTRENTTVG